MKLFCEKLLLKRPNSLEGKRIENGHLRQWQKGEQRSLPSGCGSAFLENSILLLSSHVSESRHMSKAIANMTTDKMIASNFTMQS